ncbi:hypothetical protein [Lacticaseibacillus mingshuiensis]|uniref:Transcriptional regulator n=1 Tax=Lacticaseibacillus mingshuiensis TaxID=2799574 RepID=A0ABW4CF21_9LACO|nr:hypothetical protein [Lacticaseibacillus mingshuiensis]
MSVRPSKMILQDINRFDVLLKKSYRSKAELAEALGICYSSVTHLNSVGVGYGIADRVAVALRSSVDELFIKKA